MELQPIVDLVYSLIYLKNMLPVFRLDRLVWYNIPQGETRDSEMDLHDYIYDGHESNDLLTGKKISSFNINVINLFKT